MVCVDTTDELSFRLLQSMLIRYICPGYDIIKYINVYTTHYFKRVPILSAY